VDAERCDGGDFAEEVGRLHGGFSRHDFKVAPAGISLDGHQHLPVHAVEFYQIRSIDVYVTQRRRRKLFRFFFSFGLRADRQLMLAQKPRDLCAAHQNPVTLFYLVAQIVQE